ncbi:hypothetical protein W911_04165 [Hyphomicrobium nitrativorans NL23]|uniref:Uncharacterized protein n=1 Tax=Hyphomicrobium nitrativorans NL23 TaxID=1029756 RepID=V5SCN5_9HYPH|nr:hypothetical protein [Hyphomicrobium nitrativorans]AHB47785.1 hypothetical protein W911_04165 [Hyphomicrobium nitrativorans NL23]
MATTDSATGAQDTNRASLEERAAKLVNPASGIANDYLNHFNEILLLIENLPTLLPEMLDELLEWRPVTYREYFAKSALPGSSAALEIYEGLDEGFRRDFESIIDGINAMATASIDVISAHRGPEGDIDPSRVSDFCENASCAIRSALNRASDLVNNGRANPVETPQGMADRLIPCVA